MRFSIISIHALKADRAADIHRENMKKKRRELEQASIDAASDLLDTDSNATFAMVSWEYRNGTSKKETIYVQSIAFLSFTSFNQEAYKNIKISSQRFNDM